MPAEEISMEKNLCKGPDEASVSCKTLWNRVVRVRRDAPLVHNITNLVVTNNTANAVLAVGASPIMAHAHPEVEEMVALCGALVVNIGTLDEYWVEAMFRAARQAGRSGRPWVLDPVGAGATGYRDRVAAALLELRAGVAAGATKGVDSTASSGEAVEAARWIARESGAVVCVSGQTDIIVGGGDGGSATVLVHNGSTMMTRVTGLGCSASAVIGAFIATAADGAADGMAGGEVLEAVAAATALFSIAGEIAAESVAGPGSLQVALLDKLYNISEEEFVSRLKIEIR